MSRLELWESVQSGRGFKLARLGSWQKTLLRTGLRRGNQICEESLTLPAIGMLECRRTRVSHQTFVRFATEEQLKQVFLFSWLFSFPQHKTVVWNRSICAWYGAPFLVCSTVQDRSTVERFHSPRNLETPPTGQQKPPLSIEPHLPSRPSETRWSLESLESRHDFSYRRYPFGSAWLSTKPSFMYWPAPDYF